MLVNNSIKIILEVLKRAEEKHKIEGQINQEEIIKDIISSLNFLFKLEKEIYKKIYIDSMIENKSNTEIIDARIKARRYLKKLNLSNNLWKS